MNQPDSIAIEVARSAFQLCEFDARRNVTRDETVRRALLPETLAQRPPIIAALEACWFSHYWGRAFSAKRHRARSVPAQHMKPCVHGNEDDANAALAIAEASWSRRAAARADA